MAFLVFAILECDKHHLVQPLCLYLSFVKLLCLIVFIL